MDLPEAFRGLDDANIYLLSGHLKSGETLQLGTVDWTVPNVPWKCRLLNLNTASVTCSIGAEDFLRCGLNCGDVTISSQGVIQLEQDIDDPEEAFYVRLTLDPSDPGKWLRFSVDGSPISDEHPLDKDVLVDAARREPARWQKIILRY